MTRKASPGTSLKIVPRLGSCSLEYATSLENPFKEGPIGCIPSYPIIKTQRTKLWSQGAFTTSTDAGKAGFITMNPWHVANNANSSTSVPNGFVQCTELATFVGSAIDLATTATPVTGVSMLYPNSPFTFAQFGAGSTNVQFRLVSAGLRIKYSGTSLAQGGTVFGLHQPNHESVDGYTASSIMSFDEGEKFVVLDQQRGKQDAWFTVLYRPVDPDDCEFSDLAGNPSGSGGTPNHIMGFLVIAPSTTPITFEYEAFANVEFTGAPARAKQLSWADPVGFAAVQSAMNIGGNRPTLTSASERVNALINTAGQVLSSVMTNAAPAIGKAAGIAAGRLMLEQQQALNPERRLIPF